MGAPRRIVVDALQVARRYSGVGRQVLALGAALHDLPDGIELELRCCADAADVLGPAFPDTTRVVTPLASSMPRWRRILAQQLRFPLRDGRDTLLVCLGDQGPVAGRARVLLVVNDVRRLVQRDGTPWAERAFYRAVVPGAVRHATVVATISEFSRGEILAATGRDALVVSQCPPPRPVLPRADDGFFLVVAARRPHKALETAVEALALLEEPQRRTLVFAGPEEGRADALHALAARLGVAVELRGWVSEADLEELYAGAALAIFPSRYEGYGLPVAECMARGVPAVASAIPAHLEIVGETGARTFEPGNATALAAALRSLAAPAARAQLGAAGHERIAALYGRGPGWRDAVLGAIARTD
jgi:alpha-1,3-rhamnosyl/mannosyltransferase